MRNKKILNEEQTNKVKAYFKRIQDVRGLGDYPLADEALSRLFATYKIIEQKGNGDPIKAANWSLRSTGSIQ